MSANKIVREVTFETPLATFITDAAAPLYTSALSSAPDEKTTEGTYKLSE